MDIEAVACVHNLQYKFSTSYIVTSLLSCRTTSLTLVEKKCKSKHVGAVGSWETWKENSAVAPFICGEHKLDSFTKYVALCADSLQDCCVEQMTRSSSRHGVAHGLPNNRLKVQQV